jgi:heme exporter protein D
MHKPNPETTWLVLTLGGAGPWGFFVWLNQTLGIVGLSMQVLCMIVMLILYLRGYFRQEDEK